MGTVCNGDNMDVLVKVKGWEKYNPRKDVKHPSWFALNNRLVEDDEFFSFSHAEFKAWIYVLSKASQKHKAEVLISYDAAHRKSNISPKEFKSALIKLETLGIVTVGDTRTLRQRDVDVTLQTDNTDNTIHNKHTDSITTEPQKATQSKSSFVEFNNETDLINSISGSTRDRWAKLYNHDAEFIEREVIKAFEYYQNKPHKTPKTLRGWTQALSSWLERGWPKHVKQGPNKAHDPFSLIRDEESPL